MALNYDRLMALDLPEKRYVYDERRSMLYALGLGLGGDPVDREQLCYVTEKDQKVLPSQATVIAWDDSWLRSCGVDFVKAVHGEQRMRLHRPIPAKAEIVSKIRIKQAFDKGPGRGALLLVETKIRSAADNSPIVDLESVVFARGDGGFGGPAGSPEPLPKVPERAPDHVIAAKTLPQAALIYRLSGDDNPLHSDPAVAAAAGFPRPILHGLCSWGNACHAIIKSCCANAPARLASFAARFTAPVYPGETLVNEIWKADGRAHFRSRVLERDVVALDYGFATLNA
ncbi:MAG: 3-alpha,7-alpha,12-alpha-trihydroxy-5-beta-cholest-24-enoyl-CoA hydratase [Alphaproteobacteria bacterium]|nr:3-alpha,7-alpha,12-alpha-trihydroxy-5-beta-cholest-24-enoyl-CoA hydratase [Alphaproteobacteria bacterium]